MLLLLIIPAACLSAEVFDHAFRKSDYESLNAAATKLARSVRK